LPEVEKDEKYVGKANLNTEFELKRRLVPLILIE
jgi:hypothetical protein